MIDENPDKDVDSLKVILQINEDNSKSDISLSIHENEKDEPEIYSLA